MQQIIAPSRNPPYTPQMDKRAAGKKGGETTVERHGHPHMSRIGKRGFDAMVAKHFGGDKDSAVQWLHAQSTERHIDRLLSERMAEQLKTQDICCEEIPIVLSPDDDVTFDWQSRVTRSRQSRRAM